MRQLDLQVETNPRAIRDARSRLRAWLRDKRCDADCVETAELVASELLTNALTHAHSVSAFHAAISRDRVHIEVHDHRATPPKVRTEVGRGGGFGLHIIHAVAVDWGWKLTAAGKVVWADIAR